jgi:hypothetical protein
LYDHLVPEGRNQSDREFRQKRGVTGWIALTGRPLRLIGEITKPLMRRICRGEKGVACFIEKYGKPMCGSRISELAAKSALAGETQYLGVPVKSLVNHDVTIGVLRYCASLDSLPLNDCDLAFLGCVAHIISAVVNNFNLQKQTLRSIKFASAVEKFTMTSNYSEFLEFVAESLSSKISSVYVAFRIGEERILRLLHAHGISAPVPDLRYNGQLSDYSASLTGITWSLPTLV